MPLILAIEPDRRQASLLAGAIRKRVGAELLLADTTEGALIAIGTRVPDLVLVPALLAPQDDAALASALRVIAAAAHVQTLTIPAFANGVTQKKRTGMLARLGLGRELEKAPDGCDPAVFADQVVAYLQECAADRPIDARDEPIQDEPIPDEPIQDDPIATERSSLVATDPPELVPTQAAQPFATEPEPEPVLEAAPLEIDEDLEGIDLSDELTNLCDERERNPAGDQLGIDSIDAMDLAPKEEIVARQSQPEPPREQEAELDSWIAAEETEDHRSEVWTPLAPARRWPTLEGMIAEIPATASLPSEPAKSEWVALIESLRLDIERLKATPAQTSHSPAAPREQSVAAAPKRRVAKKAQPVQDEWGFFDPEQCGFAALLAKLDEITEGPDDPEAARALTVAPPLPPP